LLGNIGRKRPHISILRTPTAISQPTVITETHKSGGFWPINEIVLLPGSEATSGGFAATRRVESPMYAVRTGVVTGSAVRSGAIVGTVKPQWITLLPPVLSVYLLRAVLYQPPLAQALVSSTVGCDV
jgi:Na+-driven multidrug efflux pump